MLLARSMRTLALGILLVPSIAVANPITLGASLGVSESKVDMDNGADSTQTLGLWGRLGFNARVAGQLEVMRYKAETGCATCTFGTTTNIRTGTALLVVDLGANPRWVPTLIAGIGLDRDDGSYPQKAHHIEGGVGLEYRGDGGIMIGADVRLGSRTIEDQVVVQNACPPNASCPQILPAFGPTQMQAGEYRSARITLGVRF